MADKNDKGSSIMVTTFSPPAKPKKKKMPVLPIALGGACAVLLAGVLYLFFQSGIQTGRISQLTDSVAQIAETVGSEALTPEVLADPAAIPEAIESVSATVAERVRELQTARSELDQQRVEANRISTERQAAMEQLAGAREQADAARRDLAERGNQLAELQARYDADTRKLEQRVEELTAQLKTLMPDEEASDGQSGLEGEFAGEATGEEEVAAPKKPMAMVVPQGASQLFKTVRYDPANSQLTFVTVDDRKLAYRNVPEAIYDGIIAAPVFDIYYRFRVMDMFESDPKDRELIRTIRR